MIEAVFVFAVLLAAFEFVLLASIPPKYRLRLLGSNVMCSLVHVLMLMLNLWVHWGTVTGTMAATGSFITSIVTVFVARNVFGTIQNNMRVKRGIVGYRNEELVM